MFNKSFVSIYFSSNILQIVRLNSAKKKIRKSATYEVPEGLIKDYRVIDPVSLAKVIKALWKKVGVKEKTVGLVVPEFSTFTKLLRLPRLDPEELDEAVNWQAKDLMPSDSSKMVLDWKIIKEEDGKVDVLVVAIDKDVLEGYVKSAELAGLFPLVVETPSLSLVRISDGDKEGKLILYESFGEAILVIAQGQKIVGSSVVDIEDHEEIIEVSTKMIRFYKGTQVKRIFMGGPKATKELATKLQTSIGKKVEWLSPKIEAKDAAELQKYLIPASLQLKGPTKPSDETTVNLLPKQLVDKYDKARLKNQIWSLTLFVSLVVWISFFSAFGVYFFLSQQIDSLKKTSVIQKIPPEKAKIIDQIREINEIAQKVEYISGVSISPEMVLNEIYLAKPKAVDIVDYSLDLQGGNIQLKGTSTTRGGLLDFKQKIEESENYSLVTIPISSFEKDKDLVFQMSFKYLPLISKKSK